MRIDVTERLEFDFEIRRIPKMNFRTVMASINQITKSFKLDHQIVNLVLKFSI